MKTIREQIEEINMKIEIIENELDNIVQELEQVERNKRAIEEMQDWMKVHLKFWNFENVRKVDWMNQFDVMKYRGKYYYRFRLNQITLNPNYKVFLVRKVD